MRKRHGHISIARRKYCRSCGEFDRTLTADCEQGRGADYGANHVATTQERSRHQTKQSGIDSRETAIVLEVRLPAPHRGRDRGRGPQRGSDETPAGLLLGPPAEQEQRPYIPSQMIGFEMRE